MIDLHQLRLFVLAAELSSFTKAAVASNVAQPTVSRVIKELEEAWCGQLFYRTGRGVALSEFGERAFAHSKELLLKADETSEELRAFGRLPTGVVTLAMPASMVPAIVPRLVNQLSTELPGIRLKIIEGLSDQVRHLLTVGEIEIGIYSKYRVGGSENDQDPVEYTSQLVLAGPSSMELPEVIDFAALAGLPLVLPSAHNGLRTTVDRVARRLNFSLNVMVDADSIYAQKLIAEKCGCYMIKVFHAIADDTEKGRYSMSFIINPSIERYVTMATTRQRPISRAGREVASRAERILKMLHQGHEDRPISSTKGSGHR